MFEMIVIGAVVLLFAGMIYGFIADRRARARMTEEEWENRDRESSLLGASVMGFDQILRPDLEKARIVQQDKRHGMMPGSEQQGFNQGDQGDDDDDDDNDDDGHDEQETSREKL